MGVVAVVAERGVHVDAEDRGARPESEEGAEREPFLHALEPALASDATARPDVRRAAAIADGYVALLGAASRAGDGASETEASE